MNLKDVFDFINAYNTVRTDSDDFIKLKHYFSAMQHNQYYSISDDELHHGVDYVKEGLKALLKGKGLSRQQEIMEEINIDSICKQFQTDLLNYKRKYENQNNHVI